ncbi:hypothetical protein [Cellulomonas sp.]|uniref:DUF6916 family protein n=1 Tax=Cellulomonas sp. TaxID=40001 RepID=UPI001B1BA4F3|nr:hypothetical protein [Cellulomonas sp.]MBO9553157.1 hypothetical protein [Cellulomonas sp.]
MLTRRTVLIAGSGVVAAGAVASAVGLDVARRQVPLELDALTPLVGERFRVTADGRTHTLVLDAVTGPDGGRPRADAFALRFGTGSTDALPGAIRTLSHPSGDLDLYLGPVGAERRQLEAVVVRTA